MDWWVFFLTFVPFLELRASLPAALAMGFSLSFSLAVCVILNILVIPLAFFLLDWIVPPLRRRFEIVDRLYKWGLRRAATRNPAGFLGLFAFVAIPLPGTGVYSGCLIAHVLSMRRSAATLAMTFGVLVAAVLIATVSWFSFSLI
ncbi:MAG: small multi-drug export protein [Candidatus Hadarchaeales archaeon]